MNKPSNPWMKPEPPEPYGIIGLTEDVGDEVRVVIEREENFRLYELSNGATFNGPQSMALLLRVLNHARSLGIGKPTRFRIRIETFHPREEV